MTDLADHRNARAEAAARAPSDSPVRVLEPSPPSVIDDDFWADDPTDPASIDRATIVPFTVHPAGGTTWHDLAGNNNDLARFTADRWLGNWRRLAPVPSDYATERDDFHRLAYCVVAATRHSENGKFGLRFTAGGFGTPFFGDDRQVRVVGHLVVDQTGATARSIRPATIDEAAAFLSCTPSTVAAEHDSPELGDTARPLHISDATGAFLGDWFGFATSVLEEVRGFADPDADPGRVQLWPGHFDPAVEIGNEAAGRRVTLGASPGDAGSADPYLYAGPWAGTTDDSFWNATSFPGAVMTYDELLAADDQRSAALGFYRTGIDLIRNR